MVPEYPIPEYYVSGPLILDIVYGSSANLPRPKPNNNSPSFICLSISFIFVGIPNSLFPFDIECSFPSLVILPLDILDSSGTILVLI
jgi:hypothetical protein